MSLLPTIVNWYGGKQKLARQIISIMPEHEHYIEVFMGSAAVFFNKPKVPKNCLNDINGNLVNLFIQVRDNYDELAEKVYWTLYSRAQYKRFVEVHNSGYSECSDVDRAVAYLFLVRANFNSQIGTGFSASVDSNSANFNLNLLERLKLARERLDSVVIENNQYFNIIEKYDTNGSLFYLDPPYWVADHEKNYYENRFRKEQHDLLALKLSKCKSNWVVSYDDIPEIVDLYKEFFISRVEVKYSTGRSDKVFKNQKVKTRKINELLITNFKHKEPQLDMFDEDISFDEVTDEERTNVEIHVKLKREKEYEQELKEMRENDTRPISKPNIQQGDLFSS